MGRISARPRITTPQLVAAGAITADGFDVFDPDNFATTEQIANLPTRREAGVTPAPYTDSLPIPTLTKRPDLNIGTRAAIGLNSLYATCLIRVPEAVYAAYPEGGRWRAYTSTDHDNGDGGINIIASSNPDPLVASAWVPLRTSGGSPKMFFDGTNNQTETPHVIPPDFVNTNLFFMYYQRKVSGTTQATYLATSANGVTGWTVVGLVLPNPSNGVAGWNHTGYAKVFRINGKYAAWHLKGSGSTVVDGYGWSFSDDGINFVQDRVRIPMGVQMTDGYLRYGISTLFHYRGTIWALVSGVNPVSGGSSSTSIKIGVAPINLHDDLRSLAGRPQWLPWTIQSPETSISGAPPSFATMDDGRLVGAMRTNGDSGFISLAVMA